MTLDERLRKRIFDILLQRAAQRTRSIGAIGASLGENPLLGIVGQPHDKSMISHRGVDLIDLQLQHVEQFLVAQLVKDDNFVQPVDEFRVEGLPHGRHHHLFQLPARNIG